MNTIRVTLDVFWLMLLVLAVVSTWGTPDLLDAIIARTGGVPMTCVTGAAP